MFFHFPIVCQPQLRLGDRNNINGEIAKNGDIDNATDKIKPPIFWKDKTIFNIQAQKWDIIKLKKILDQTYKLELLIKSNSQISQALLIKKLLINICCLANAS